MDLRRLRAADHLVAGGTLLYLVLALLPWRTYGGELSGLTFSGFQGSVGVGAAFALFVLAAAWALVAAIRGLDPGFPRAWVTVGLALPGFLLTLVAWLATFDAGFSVWALLGLLTAAAILLFAVFPLVRDRPGADAAAS